MDSQLSTIDQGPLGQALRLAKVGLWEWDVARDRVVWTEVLYDIFGVDPESFKADYQGYLGRVHPEDRAEVEKTIQAAFANGTTYQVRHRVVRDDGSVRHVQSTGEAMQQDGKTVHMRGAAADVTVAAEVDRLRELNDFKARFISVAAHELRTPITPLRLQLHILRDKYGPTMEPGERKALEIMGRNIERLADLVDDVLQAARLQSNKLRVTVKPTDVTRLLEHVGESFEGAAHQVKVELVRDIQPDLRAEVDPARFEQVVTNLITNAIKFTPEGGRVRLEARAQRASGDRAGGDRVAVRVSDSGIGMTPEQVSRLFAPFTQVHDSPEQRMRGTGLGLYISKGIVEEHGGTLTASSAGPGQGATFTLLVPSTGKPVEADPPARPATAARRYRELI